MKIFLLALAALILPLAGCNTAASIGARADKGRHIAADTRFFVLGNLNDNHDLDARISRALRDRGLQSWNGPQTMMPDDTQVLLTYEDDWTWDFSDHMVYLKISARDPKTNASFASAVYRRNVAFNTNVDDVVERLTNALLKSLK